MSWDANLLLFLPLREKISLRMRVDLWALTLSSSAHHPPWSTQYSPSSYWYNENKLSPKVTWASRKIKTRFFYMLLYLYYYYFFQGWNRFLERFLFFWYYNLSTTSRCLFFFTKGIKLDPYKYIKEKCRKNTISFRFNRNIWARATLWCSVSIHHRLLFSFLFLFSSLVYIHIEQVYIENKASWVSWGTSPATVWNKRPLITLSSSNVYAT